MTKNEAIEAMKEGKKVQHQYFTKDEWVSSDKDGELYTFEDGVKVSSREFWHLRSASAFEKDWSLYEPKN